MSRNTYLTSQKTMLPYSNRRKCIVTVLRLHHSRARGAAPKPSQWTGTCLRAPLHAEDPCNQFTQITHRDCASRSGEQRRPPSIEPLHSTNDIRLPARLCLRNDKSLRCLPRGSRMSGIRVVRCDAQQLSSSSSSSSSPFQVQFEFKLNFI